MVCKKYTHHQAWWCVYTYLYCQFEESLPVQLAFSVRLSYMATNFDAPSSIPEVAVIAVHFWNVLPSFTGNGIVEIGTSILAGTLISNFSTPPLLGNVPPFAYTVKVYF